MKRSTAFGNSTPSSNPGYRHEHSRLNKNRVGGLVVKGVRLTIQTWAWYPSWTPCLWSWASHFTLLASSSFEWDVKPRFLVPVHPCQGPGEAKDPTWGEGKCLTCCVFTFSKNSWIAITGPKWCITAVIWRKWNGPGTMCSHAATWETSTVVLDRLNVIIDRPNVNSSGSVHTWYIMYKLSGQ
jgi:hypothetical protein